MFRIHIFSEHLKGVNWQWTLRLFTYMCLLQDMYFIYNRWDIFDT